MKATGPGQLERSVSARQRVDVVAWSRAHRALAEAHPEEFDRLLRRERKALGLPAVAVGYTGIAFDRASFRRQWRDGASYAELAEEFGMSKQTVWRHGVELGLVRRRNAVVDVRRCS